MHILGLMRTLSLHRDPVGYYGHPHDHGGNSTGETGGGEAPGIQRRAVEDR
jgi:hypothetical protein